MSADSLLDLLAAPPKLDEDPWSSWFASIAEELLVHRSLRVDGEPHELCEIEFYFHGEVEGRSHLDPFTHNDPLQKTCGRWYFHRAGASYRGGTYKGLDITFGPVGEYGGILIRSLRTPEGRVINGSSLCVEHLLARTGQVDVASLDAAIAERAVDDPDSPLALVPREPAGSARIWATARVGLTLKRVEQHPEMLDYIMRPYRCSTAARELDKGRVQLVIALHEQGSSVAAIAEISGSPKRSVEAYVAAYEEGRALASSRPFWGRSLDSKDLCRLAGALAAERV